MKLNKSDLIQIVILFIFSILGAILINNLIVNLMRNDMGISFNWLLKPAGFALSENSLPYKPTDTYAWALIVGLVNGLKVIGASLFLSTIIGTISGVCAYSSNILLRNLSKFYVALVRQIPLLLQLLFWYFVCLLNLPKIPITLIGEAITLSNQGINLIGIKLSPEFTALLLGLSVFTGASIAEVIRGAINSVEKGQWEAFKSLGISFREGLRLIVLPQAMPAIIPGLTSQYLNLAKNSTLAIAIGYADIYAIGDTTITQTGRAIEVFFLLLICFLILNLMISQIMERLNKVSMRYQLKR